MPCREEASSTTDIDSCHVFTPSAAADCTQLTAMLLLICREEARSTAEFDYIIFRRVFTPVQGARLIIEAYPLRCDCLAFTNAVVQLHGPHFTVPEHGASAGSSMGPSGVSSEGGTASKGNASQGFAVSTSMGGVSQATRPDAALQRARG